MKKVLLLIICIIQFVPIFCYAEKCDENKISIKSITMLKRSDTVTELNNANIQNQNINLNLSMAKEGDTIEYKIVIKNDSKDVYVFNKNNINVKSNYLEYNINSEDGSNLVKAKSSKVFIMSINYKNKLSNNDYESGIYKENRDIKISLSNNKSNPNTSPNIMIIIIFLLLILAITGITKTKKISLLLITILLIPIYIYAECRYDINISSKILIEGNDPNATEDGPYYNINKDKHYRILNNAFKSARDNQKIIVLEDVEDEPSATIPSSLKNLKLDLNGKRINFKYVEDKSVLINNGEIEVLNTSEEEGILNAFQLMKNNGLLTIEKNATLQAEIEVIFNEKTMYVESGIIGSYDAVGVVNRGTIYVKSGEIGSYISGIDNYNKVIATGGIISGYNGIRNNENNSYALIEKDTNIIGVNNGIINEGTVDFKGGKIDARYTGIRNKGTVNIDGGEINVNNSSSVESTNGIYNEEGNINIKSGHIVANATSIALLSSGIHNNGKVTMSGGTVEGYSQTDTFGIGIDSYGTSTILSGYIIGSYRGININNNSIVELGKNDNYINISEPIVYGKKLNSFGIDNYNNGTFNYYDGTIQIGNRGNNSSPIWGEITNKPNGYKTKIVTEGDIIKTYLVKE